ncbi:glycosyltransferase family 4 protein [Pseudomonas lundensis]|uniref:glycosyltransferase n=1 Tax=Pseudomonas lundensis TaxID=86185 RepID=UPI0014729454|nr:glycosyltransferase [Pseudomonas lundensis]NNA23502.1 glycosyltransferase family 4 protein [Pseudomonas lundensis]
MKIKKFKVARVSTVPFFILTQLKSQLENLFLSNAAITVIASRDEMSSLLDKSEFFNYIGVNIEREINLPKDIVSLFELVRIFRNSNFEIIHSTTPKAGLLCAIAGFIARNPVRLHTFTGQTWTVATGFKRYVLKLCDKVIGILNTHCYADSSTQMDFLVSQGVIKSDKISVLGSGSLAGIDLDRFDPVRYSQTDLCKLRSEIGIPLDSKILLFVGRITLDKGISELIQAFSSIVKNDESVYLVLVGPYEPSGKEIINQISDQEVIRKIKLVGYTDEPEIYMALADLLCLPSYREGFGTVVIEAAAMCTPTVGTNIYGLADSIVDGRTGMLVAVNDAASLEKAITNILNDPQLLSSMAIAARNRAVSEFDSKVCSQLLLLEYERFLK